MGFTKKIEDFVCERCGTKVKGTGYSNHCPKCLWSKHVDKDPGDRQEPCAGLMEPVGLAQEKGEWVLTHRCRTCGFSRRQSAGKNDSADALVAASQKVCGL